MSEALEAEQKTNPQGDPITSVAAPKPVNGREEGPPCRSETAEGGHA